MLSHYTITNYLKKEKPIKQDKNKYPIPLTEQEVKWIKLLKGHYKDYYKYRYKGTEWTDVLKPMFEDIYGYSPDEHYSDFLDCMFSKLLDIHFKISDNNQTELRGVFNASFYKRISRQQELPIERAISELCGIIQGNIVVDGDTVRYKLD